MFRLHGWSIKVDSPYFLNKKFRKKNNAAFSWVSGNISEKS